MTTENTITVSLGGIKSKARLIGGIIIPVSLYDQALPWIPFLTKIQRIVGDRLLITSVKDSFSGAPRTGASHPNGWAIDVTLPDRIRPSQNPHLENDIYLMTHLSASLSGPILIAFESDHIHIEVSDVLKGVYRYPTSRPVFYSNDKLVSPRIIQDEQLWKVQPDSIILMKDQNLITKQRVYTEKLLSVELLTQMIAKTNL